MVADLYPLFAAEVKHCYLADSDLLAGLSEINSGLEISRTFEPNRNLLTEVLNEVGANVVSRYEYANDAVGRRTSVMESGDAFKAISNTCDLAAFMVYGYNERSELTSAKKYFGTDLGQTNNLVAGQSWAYGYDNIGNRTNDTRAGNQASPSAFIRRLLSALRRARNVGAICKLMPFSPDCQSCSRLASA